MFDALLFVVFVANTTSNQGSHMRFFRVVPKFFREWSRTETSPTGVDAAWNGLSMPVVETGQRLCERFATRTAEHEKKRSHGMLVRAGFNMRGC